MHLPSSHADSSACKPNSPYSTVLPRSARPRTRPRWCFRYLTRFGISAMSFLVGQIVTLIDPHLYTDRSLSRLGLGKSIADLGTKSLQRDRAGERLFLSGHFGAG